MGDEVLAELRELRARVEALEADNARLRERATSAATTMESGSDGPVERRQLLKLVGPTSGPSTAVRWPEGERAPTSIGRRSLLGAGAAVAVGAIAAIGDGRPAAATPGQPLVVGRVNTTGGSTTELSGEAPFGAVLRIGNDTAYEVSDGVYAQVRSVRGVFGVSVDGAGVFGEIVNGNAVEARIDGERSANGFNAVYATTFGRGNGVFGEAAHYGKAANGVLGIANGTGNSVFGFKRPGVNGDAVVGYSQSASSRGVLGVSTDGRGGAFGGKAAQVQLLPSSATTHPTSGQRGDLFVDKSGRLWFCKGASTWKQLA